MTASTRRRFGDYLTAARASPLHDHIASASDAAAREIIAAAASLGGEAGLKDLAADLVVALSAMIRKEAAMQGRSAIEMVDVPFSD